MSSNLRFTSYGITGLVEIIYKLLSVLEFFDKLFVAQLPVGH